MTFIIRKAEKRKAKLRLALCGVSGSGKTLSALKIAKGMGFDACQTVVIDTESTGDQGGSAELYADEMDFDTCLLSPPYSPERYIEAIHACEKAGYKCIIVDSLTHAWSGIGGALDMHDKATQSSSTKNSYTAWRNVTPWHNRLVDALVRSPAHIICTMRSKTEHSMVDDNGKKRPVKIGLAPVQREGMDYEFTVVFTLEHESHLFTVSKDRTRMFNGKNELADEKIGGQLIDWLNSGVEVDDGLSVEDSDDYKVLKKIAKEKGTQALGVAWAALDRGKKHFLESSKDSLKELAAETDAAKAANDAQDFLESVNQKAGG
jgi:hypothetical protein